MEPMKKKWCIALAVTVLVLLIIVAVVLGVVLSQEDAAPQEEPRVDDLISQNASFPIGSFSLAAGSFAAGSAALAPRNLTESQLNEWGIRVDDSSLVAETGRLSFFYIWLPSEESVKSKTPSAGKRHTRQVAGTALGGNIGIRFGAAGNVNVVPIALADTPLSGLRRIHQHSDGSSVFELQIRMPASMCETSASCTVINWRPYSVSGDRKSASAAEALIQLPVACGSQCDTAADSACARSCEPCDSGTVAGADTPVTRRYNLGSTSGTVEFQYQTYNVRDRVTLVYEGKVIHDSGCVGTQTSVDIPYQGATQEMRVDVEPNCEGTTGTAWNFKLACPLPCLNLAGSNKVRLLNGGQEVNDGDAVFIRRDARMPALTAHYCGDPDSTASIQWTLTIDPFTFTIPAGATKEFCPTLELQGRGEKWDILEALRSSVQGGSALLSWRSTNVGQTNAIEGSMTFQIRGTQPTASDVTALIQQSLQRWFALPVAKHESELKQFTVDSGAPLISYDFGVGIYQLTTPQPTCDQVWNWQANVRAGLAMLEQRSQQARGWMTDQRAQARREMQRDVPVPDVIEAKCLFKDGSASVIEDAVALKWYNGATKHYCSWNNAGRNWAFNKDNTLPVPFNYVNRVCQRV